MHWLRAQQSVDQLLNINLMKKKLGFTVDNIVTHRRWIVIDKFQWKKSKAKGKQKCHCIHRDCLQTRRRIYRKRKINFAQNHNFFFRSSSNSSSRGTRRVSEKKETHFSSLNAARIENQIIFPLSLTECKKNKIKTERQHDLFVGFEIFRSVFCMCSMCEQFMSSVFAVYQQNTFRFTHFHSD